MVQVQIFFDKDKFKDDKPMTDYMMEFLADADILGATAFRGELGFGENQKIKRPGRLFSFDDPPMVITFIDEDEKVRKVLTALRKKVKTGFIVLNTVEIWK
jgi:PII-like signaling protein